MLLAVFGEGEIDRTTLQVRMGLSDRKSFRAHCRLQRYRLTAAGKTGRST